MKRKEYRKVVENSFYFESIVTFLGGIFIIIFLNWFPIALFFGGFLIGMAVTLAVNTYCYRKVYYEEC